MPPNLKYTPREPTQIEQDEIGKANLKYFGDEYQPDYIAVWDSYISDGPGYVGWAALSFGGEPDYVTGYTRDVEGVVEVCSFAQGKL